VEFHSSENIRKNSRFFAGEEALWICGQSARPIPAFALRAILWTARGKRCAFTSARPQVGGCPQAPQRTNNQVFIRGQSRPSPPCPCEKILVIEN